jgi:hypothetical protein
MISNDFIGIANAITINGTVRVMTSHICGIYDQLIANFPNVCSESYNPCFLVYIKINTRTKHSMRQLCSATYTYYIYTYVEVYVFTRTIKIRLCSVARHRVTLIGLFLIGVAQCRATEFSLFV